MWSRTQRGHNALLCADRRLTDHSVILKIIIFLFAVISLDKHVSVSVDQGRDNVMSLRWCYYYHCIVRHIFINKIEYNIFNTSDVLRSPFISIEFSSLKTISFYHIVRIAHKFFKLFHILPSKVIVLAAVVECLHRLNNTNLIRFQ